MYAVKNKIWNGTQYIALKSLYYANDDASWGYDR